VNRFSQQPPHRRQRERAHDDEQVDEDGADGGPADLAHLPEPDREPEADERQRKERVRGARPIDSSAAGERNPLFATAATARNPSRNFGNSAHSRRTRRARSPTARCTRASRRRDDPPNRELRASFVTVAHWPASGERANPAAATGPVENILTPAQTPNCRPVSPSHSPAIGNATSVTASKSRTVAAANVIADPARRARARSRRPRRRAADARARGKQRGRRPVEPEQASGNSSASRSPPPTRRRRRARARSAPRRGTPRRRRPRRAGRRFRSPRRACRRRRRAPLRPASPRLPTSAPSPTATTSGWSPSIAPATRCERIAPTARKAIPGGTGGRRR